MNIPKSLFLLSTLVILVLSPFSAIAQEKPQSEALESGKIVWDIALGNTPLEFNQYLDIIHDTYKDLVRENITPDMVLVFRGLSVRWLTRSKQQMWSQEAIDKVVAKLRAFRKKPGVQFVADLPAHQEMKVSTKDLLPGVKVVKNGFIALMRYHQQGYMTISLN